jgi:hypothetical protein
MVRSPVWFSALLALLAACPGSLDHPERFTTTGDSGVTMTADAGGCVDVANNLLPMRCAGPGACHGSGAQSQDGLDFVTAGIATRIVSKHSISCPGRTVVSTAAPDMSVILDRISANPMCGARMPLGLPPLSDADIACVHAWVIDIVRTSTGGR